MRAYTHGLVEGRPRVAIWGTFDVANYGDLLFPRIFELEMRRRLPEADIRSFAPLGHLHPVPLDGGFLAESLTPWHQERAAHLAEQLDMIAIGGGEIIHTHDELYRHWYGETDESVQPSQLFIETLGADHETQCPVVWHAVGIPFDFDPAEAARVRTAVERRPYLAVRDEVSRGRLRAAGVTAAVDVIPDSALLLDRLFSPDVLKRRLRFLRAIGAYPEGTPPLVIQGSGGMLPVVDAVAKAVTAVLNDEASDPVPLVLLETGPCHDDGAFADALASRLPSRIYRVGDGATVEDVAAAIVHARAVAGVSLHAAITAFTYGVPHAILNLVNFTKLAGFASLGGYDDLHVTMPDDVEQALQRILARAKPQTPPAELAARVDAHFDRLAELASRSAAARTETANNSPLDALRRLEARYEALLRAHETRGARLVEERLRFSALIERLEDGEGRKADLAALEHAQRELERRGAELSQANAEVAQTSAELALLQTTKTFRYTRLARQLYARLRARV